MTDQRQSPKYKSWTEYRAAFDRLSIQVRQLQKLTAKDKPDPTEIEAALIAVELARQDYNASRDVLAREMLQRSTRRIPRARHEFPGSDLTRVKAIAKLLWDLTGRPEGKAEENWYRAEDIIRRTHALAACC
jgi:DUF2934 family protein